MNSISLEGISSLQTAQARHRVDTAVLAKTHEVANKQGEAAIGLLEAASESVGQAAASHEHHVDITA